MGAERSPRSLTPCLSPDPCSDWPGHCTALLHGAPNTSFFHWHTNCHSRQCSSVETTPRRSELSFRIVMSRAVLLSASAATARRRSLLPTNQQLLRLSSQHSSINRRAKVCVRTLAHSDSGQVTMLVAGAVSLLLCGSWCGSEYCTLDSLLQSLEQVTLRRYPGE